MSHNIEFNKEKENHSFVSAKEAAWHKLGTILPKDGLTAAECIKYVNLEFNVTKQPLKVVIGEKLIDVPDQYATVRSDTDDILGIVGSQYEVLQNKEAFEFFDPLISEEEAYYETCGLLDNGKRMFLTAKLPAHIRINNSDDIIEQYLFLTSGHDGKYSVNVGFTNLRIVCANTLNSALKNCKSRLSIRHTTNMQNKVKEAHKIMGIQNLYTKEISEIFNNMAKKKVDDKIYERIIVTALSDNDKMIEDYFKGEASTRFSGNVSKCMEYAYNDETQKIFSTTHETLFGAYNAVTGFNANVTTYKDDSSAVQQQIDPNGRSFIRAQKAFDLCLDYLKK